MENNERGIGSVLDNFLKTEKPVAPPKPRITAFNMRVDEKLRDDFRRWCFDHNTDMTKEIVQFMHDTLEERG